VIRYLQDGCGDVMLRSYRLSIKECRVADGSEI
jgi:hypothetical protein